MTTENTIPPTPPPSEAEIALAVDARKLLQDALGGTTKELKMSTEALSLYTAQRAAVLATLVGQKGFDQALMAERDNIALRGAIEIGRTASGADQRAIGIIQSILLFGAKKLAGVP